MERWGSEGVDPYGTEDVDEGRRGFVDQEGWVNKVLSETLPPAKGNGVRGVARSFLDWGVG